MNEKLQKQIEETKDEWKIILASMVIPFLYMLLSLVEYTLTYPFNDPTHHPILWTEWIAGYFLFMFIPPILIAFSIVFNISKYSCLYFEKYKFVHNEQILFKK